MSLFLRVIFVFTFLGTWQVSAYAQGFIQYDAKSLAQTKQDIAQGKANPYTQKAYTKLIQYAEAALLKPNDSVVDKTFSPPSKSKHDYLSISRYWWPDPSTEDGLPWIRKDGVTNPSTQTDDVDRPRMGRMTSGVKYLSLAYYFSGKEVYAQKAISMINTWFLDEKTRMNPHLEYAQSVPGNPKGRRSGILDGRLISTKILDSLTLLSQSPAWKAEYQKEMNTWLQAYLNWLTQSKLGKQGAQQTNNHGSWYNFQVTSLAMYLGDKALVNKMIERVKQSYAFQFDEKGAQPHELKRTRSYFYSCFNLNAMTLIANISEKAGNSLWDYQSKDGKSLAQAINFLLPATQGAAWPYKTKGVEPSYIAPILARISSVSDNEKYPQILHKILTDLKNEKEHMDDKLEISMYFALLHPKFLP